MNKSSQLKVIQYFNTLLNSIDVKDFGAYSMRVTRKLRILGLIKPKALQKGWENLQLMRGLLVDYTKGTYSDVPWKTITAIAGAILYFVTPFDVSPDLIPIAGYIDDAFIINLVFTTAEQELSRYAKWKSQQRGNPSVDRLAPVGEFF